MAMTERARWSFFFRRDNDEYAEFSYTGMRDIEYDPLGIWYAPFANEPQDSYVFGLLESAWQVDGAMETPETVLQQLMYVYGEPYKVSVSRA